MQIRKREFDDTKMGGFNIHDIVNKNEQSNNWEEEPGTEVNKTKENCFEFEANGKKHLFSKKSIWLFGHENKFRKKIINIITHRFFDSTIVFLIMVNSLMLGVKDYTDIKNETNINRIVENSEPLFVWAFTIECVFKIIGMGFILDQGSYLRDAWNWLDFIVVFSSLLTEVPQMNSVSGMRTFRLMRPLRSLTTMPSMKILISTLLASVS